MDAELWCDAKRKVHAAVEVHGRVTRFVIEARDLRSEQREQARQTVAGVAMLLWARHEKRGSS
jgi:hypothetical protein